MNLPTKKSTSATERKGVNFVRGIVEGANCNFTEIDQRNDFGIDAIIELVDAEKVTGKSIGIQIKSGISYCKGLGCTIPASKEHFAYWANHSLPIVGIVYDPGKPSAYWVDISVILKQEPTRIGRGPYVLNFKKREICEFSSDGFRDFFLPIFLKQPIRLSLERSIEFAKSEYMDMHRVGLTSLLDQFRHLDTVWDLFFDLFMARPIENMSGFLVYIFSLIPGHPDIYWHSGNIIKETQRQRIEGRLRLTSTDFVSRLLFFVDENGFYRGSLGQCVEAIISLNPGKMEILGQISLDDSNNIEVRKAALMLYAFYAQKKAIGYLDRLAKADTPIAEFSRYLRADLEEHGSIDIFG